MPQSLRVGLRYTAAVPRRRLDISTLVLSASDKALFDLASAAPASDISGAIARLKAIDALLPANDGLKWFNRLYLMVTEQVDLNPPGGAWRNPVWLDRLDVVFAGFYFNAIRASLAGEATPASWSALFASRFRGGVDRIQFAVAGMNAHINHDLALALMATNAELGVTPVEGGPERTDYESVNTLLNSVMPSALNMLAADTLGEAAQDTGKIGRVLAFWDICAAREFAWDFAEHLSDLPGIARPCALDLQDSLTGALGLAILTAV